MSVFKTPDIFAGRTERHTCPGNKPSTNSESVSPLNTELFPWVLRKDWMPLGLCLLLDDSLCLSASLRDGGGYGVIPNKWQWQGERQWWQWHRHQLGPEWRMNHFSLSLSSITHCLIAEWYISCKYFLISRSLSRESFGLIFLAPNRETTCLHSICFPGSMMVWIDCTKRRPAKVLRESSPNWQQS